MLKKMLLSSCLLSGIAVAGDGTNSIDLTFSGTIVKPSCNIQFESGGNNKTIDFGPVNVSDIRYFKAGKLGGSGAAAYTYSKYISSDVFRIAISGCSPEQISTVDGGQFSLTIAPVVGKWVNILVGSAVLYMNGSIQPPDGSAASGFGAKFLVPNAKSGMITDNPDSWAIFTDESVSIRAQSTNVPSGDIETGKVSNLKVNFSQLSTAGSGDTMKWLIPMKVKLGMVDADQVTETSGEFHVSASITATYY